MWARIINTAAGIWMMIAPSVFGYEKAASDNACIFGALIATTAIIAMAESVRDIRLLNLLFGIWVLLAPWILSFAMPAKINDTLVGLIVAALSLVRGTVKERFGGGWKAIFRKSQVP